MEKDKKESIKYQSIHLIGDLVLLDLKYKMILERYC